jgi:hypothetical protein
VASGFDGVDAVKRVIGKWQLHEVCLHRDRSVFEAGLLVQFVAADYLVLYIRVNIKKKDWRRGILRND